MVTREQFVEHLRGALAHLYDPEFLGRSPLAELFGVAGRYDTASAMRRILGDAIEALQPDAAEPPLSRAWRIYYTLVYLYLEQATQEQAADQLAISTRQLRREQRVALEQLADRLWDTYDLARRAPLAAQPPPDPLLPSHPIPPGLSTPDLATLDQELGWLKDGAQGRLRLDELLAPVEALSEKLAQQHRTRLVFGTGGASPKLGVHPVAFRQILLNLLSVVIPRASGGTVQVSARVLEWDVEIHIRCPSYPSGAKPTLPDEAANLNLASRLAEMSGCKLVLNDDARAFEARLSVAALEQLPVLAIDDSADALLLLQRYVAGTRYRIIPAQDPKEALEIAERMSPRIIVLDVMMPELDGWELLARLREHPLTAGLPIIVCTILAQTELAQLLGANDLIRKPITQQAFLAALDRQFAQIAETVCH